LALPRGEPDFEDTVLARQRYRLSEIRSNCGICSSLGSLRPGRCTEAFKRQEDSEGTACDQRNQATCVENVVE
jgi:hypothetical protein